MEHVMAYCHTCETECADITRHLFSHHTHPGAASPIMAAGAPNEVEPGEAEDETFCYQCSREFRTAAALATHLGGARVHFRGIQNRDPVLLGIPGYPDATGLDREYTLQDDQDSLYEASSTDSEELTSESDDVPINTEYPTQSHSGAIPVSSASLYDQNPQTSGPVTGDAQPAALSYAPGAYTFTSSSSTVHTLGLNGYAQEGMSTSYSYSESELTPGMSNYYHRPGAHGPDVSQTKDLPSLSHMLQTHDASTPKGHGIMCPICLEPAENITSTLCGHIFCWSCIRSALSMREACPVCNRATGRWSTHPIYPVLY